MGLLESLEARRLMAAGDRDLTFGDGGNIVLGGPAVTQPDGKIVVLADLLTRYFPDGSLDPSFGVNGLVDEGLLPPFDRVIRVQSDGALLVGGTEPNTKDVVVARFLADGSPDATFGDGGSTKIDFFYDDVIADIAVAPDGRIAVLANLSPEGIPSMGFEGGAAVFVLETDGDIDTSFNGFLPLIWSPAEGFHGDERLTPYAIATEFSADGTLFVGGTLTTVPFDLAPVTTDGIVHAYRPDGSRVFATTVPHNAGGGGGEIGQAWQRHAVRDFAANPDGSMLVAAGGGRGTDMLVLRLNSTGQLDTAAFGNGAGYVSVTLPKFAMAEPFLDRAGADEIELLPDGRFYVRAHNHEAQQRTNQFLFRLNPDGSPDPAFSAPLLLRSSKPLVRLPKTDAFTVSGDDAVLPLFGERLDDGPPLPTGLQKFLGGTSIRMTRIGTLQIAGTSGADTVPITRRARDGKILAVIGDQARVLLPQMVKRIQVFGYGGDDVVTIGPNVRGAFIDGGGGSDTITGGNGDDWLVGGVGNDSLIGGLGNDLLYGNAGNDYLLGSAGHDTIHGHGGRDTLLGTLGNDQLYGGPGSADRVYGGLGYDLAADDPLDQYIDLERLLA